MESDKKDKAIKEKMNRAYLDSKINRIIEPMVVELMKKTPDDPITFMINWLKDNHGNRASIHANERFELEHLRKEVPKLKERIAQLDNGEGDDEEVGSEQESAGSDEGDYVDELPKKAEAKANKQRTSVSAEAFGLYHKKEDFKPVVIKKEKQLTDRIRKRLAESFLFNTLNEKDQNIVLDAMKEENFKKGDLVIREGDDGDVLYVVESGLYNCSKIWQTVLLAVESKTHSTSQSTPRQSLIVDECWITASTATCSTTSSRTQLQIEERNTKTSCCRLKF